jgi:hypothetical protein
MPPEHSDEIMKVLATPSPRPSFSRSRLREPVVDVANFKKRSSRLPWSELKGVQEQVPIDCAQVVEGVDVDRRLMSFVDNVVAYIEQATQSKFVSYPLQVELVNLGQPSFQGDEPSGSRHGENIECEPVHKKAVDPLDL